MTEFKTEEGSQFVKYMGPALDALRTLGDSGTPDEVTMQVAKDLSIPDAMLDETLVSGANRFKNRVAFARLYLVHKGLVDRSVRGIWTLTEKGRQTSLTLDQAREIHVRWNKRFQDERKQERERKAARTAKRADPDTTPAPADDPEIDDVDEELIALIIGLTASGFERLCQRLLRESGFTQVTVTGRPNDGGIDGHGILELNSLVSFKVLFQCKKYAGSVSPSHVRDFRGAMEGRAEKGIILATGSFTTEALREATREGAKPIELIDGPKLVTMMKKLQLGLRPIMAYEIDRSFFNEFRN